MPRHRLACDGLRPSAVGHRGNERGNDDERGGKLHGISLTGRRYYTTTGLPPSTPPRHRALGLLAWPLTYHVAPKEHMMQRWRGGSLDRRTFLGSTAVAASGLITGV